MYGANAGSAPPAQAQPMYAQPPMNMQGPPPQQAYPMEPPPQQAYPMAPPPPQGPPMAYPPQQQGPPMAYPVQQQAMWMPPQPIPGGWVI